MPNLSRRHLVTAAAALPALAVPAAATTLANDPDPIFAAIERHRRSCSQTTAAFKRWTALEEADATQETIDAVDVEATAATVAQDDIARDLLHIQPTTVAGASAVLNYYAEVEATGEQVFPEFLDDDGNRADTSDDDGTKTYPAFGYLLARNVARALAQMAVQL